MRYLHPWKTTLRLSPRLLPPYGLTKAWAEVFLTSLRGDAKSGLSTVTILRPATVYGPETPPLSGFQRRIAALQSPEGATIAAPDGYLHNPLFIDDLIDVLVRLCLLPRNLTANVGGPTAMTEGELLRDLGAQLSQRSDSVGAPRIRIDASSQAVSYVVSNAAINRAFPERMQTAWLTGLRQCF
jgi:nucleoside-diphosphate-sugar epimerase